ncbi:MAG: Cysteine desulfurase [uncultured Corynebacteriales bacterium]|uniref:Cysteine desulfurase n=1 Tax=uncultured Mycobacteriales bacterium TaxID=581187 RepID=A0A6J4JA78_9ACTN|nr:MAG: Cysteine desulfurase [uncultured Corynebacteriales bacterium]
MPFDVARVRGLFPTLGDGYIHLDGPAGTLIPESVARSVSAALRVPLSNRRGPFPSSARADALVDAARRAFADVVGGEPSGVVLGPNMTTITYNLARAIGKTWKVGDEVVLSRLDHDANVRPWIAAAKSAGAVVRWAEIDIETCELPEWQYDDLINRRTRLVAVTGASNAVGTRPDVRAIAERAHRVGALVFVDGVHATAHAPVDMAESGADFWATSAYKWGGPHVGAVVAAPAVLERLAPDKLMSSPDSVPDRFETGTPAFELMAGAVAAVDHLAGLDDTATGTRRQRIRTSMAAVQRYEESVFSRLDNGLRSMLHVYVLGSPAHRAPTVSFSVEGWKPRAVTEELARRGICAWDGDYYAYELMESLGVGELGGAVRVGLVHYNTAHEVDRLLDALQELR